MATTLYFKQQFNGLPSLQTYQYSSLERSVLTFLTGATATQTAGVDIQMTSAGDAPLQWISPPIATPLTISGSITTNTWAYMNAVFDTTVAISIAKMSGGTVGSPFLLSSYGTALGTSGVENWSASPTPTAFAVGDRLVIEVLITNATGHTMSSGQTVGFDYAGNAAGADGDSWVEFTENISFQAEAEVIQIAGSGTDTLTMSGTTAAGNVFFVFTDYTQGGSISSIGDSTNSYSTIGSNAGVPTLLGFATYFAGNLTAGGPYSITVVPAGGTTINLLQAVEVAGVATSPYVSGSGQFGTSLTGTAITTTNFTTPANTNAIILVQIDNAETVIPGTNFYLIPGTGIGYQSVQAATFTNAPASQATSNVWLDAQATFYWGTQPPAAGIIYMLGHT